MYRIHSLVLLKFHDDPQLPNSPLVARVATQPIPQSPNWMEAEVFELGRHMIRGSDCYALTPPKGCAKPEIRACYDSPARYAQAKAAITDPAKVRCVDDKLFLAFDLGTQPCKAVGAFYGAHFELGIPTPPEVTPEL